MVDRVSSSHHNGIDELTSNQLLQKQQIERVNRESAEAPSTGSNSLFLDQADISDAALARLEAEREAFQFASLANRADEPFDQEKVSRFKTLLESGKISEYLNNLSNESLADDILNSPLGASLR